MADYTYGVIGNSIAGVNAIEALREHDPDGSILLLDREDAHVYSRPLISYWLGGEIVDDVLPYRPADFYERFGVETALGVSVDRIDAAARSLALADGRSVTCEKLLVATGGAPIVPPIEGVDGPGVYTFTSLEDARRLDAVAKPGMRAVVLGGGLIGIKAAHALFERGLIVSIVELMPRILGLALDGPAGAIIAPQVEAAGVAMYTEDTIEEIVRHGDGSVRACMLKSGTEVRCDLVVVAIGVRPNLSLLDGAGVATDRGILVDRQMRTSAEGVYAAGDVAQGRNLLTGQDEVIAILPVAARMGRAAGAAMAGADGEYPGGVPMNSVDIFGVPVITLGMSNADEEADEVLSDVQPDDKIYRKLLLKDGRLLGGIFLTAIDRAGLYAGLMLDRTDVSGFTDTLLSEDFGWLSVPKAIRHDRILARSLREGQYV